MGIRQVMTEVRAIFLDRDGVLNRAIVRDRKPYPPDSVTQVEIIPGAVHSMGLLEKAGYLLIGITNQPDVARGTQKKEIVEEINACILNALPVREIFTCYHDNLDNCNCRKPKPGLILQAAKKYNVQMNGSWMIGDRWKDIAAGKVTGLKTVFIDYHYDEGFECQRADYTIQDVSELAKIVLNSR
jgi:D-glycero-D-manno-heptose 1,7-bisphosphate phosphatase